MKKLLNIFTVILLVSCNSENAPDCFQNSGDIITKEFTVTPFTKITVFENVEMVITDAPDYKVTVATGEFLMSDIEVKVEGERLKLYDNNGCNLTRDYGITKIYVEAPNVEEIRSSTGLTIRSNGVLTYPTLKLLSEDNSGDFTRSGNFEIEVANQNLSVTVNALSTPIISGTTDRLSLFYASGDSRFEGRTLIAQEVNIFHRGTNDITVNPQIRLTANLVSTGNVISVNTPADLDIQEQYTGRVIFE
ncbi:head GIN domain-containing protein [Aurantibacter sp.]|uniref:head GIN domain-containing protein n=1 Tax=Aurantibacter sp. TaxID=2807103 RepID=UPI0035C82F21